MNVMNRKMFKKSRPARDALNQAGGIMDSSPELMQTVQNYPVPGVQNFANGSNVRIPGRSIYAEEGPGDGTVLRQLQDTFQMRQDPNYIPLNERGISTIKHFMGERYPFAPSTNYGDPNYQPIFDPYKQRRIYAKSGMAPDLVLDDQGISTGYDTDGNLVLSQPRQAFTVDAFNPADLSESGIASQLAIDKAAIAKFQAANAPDAAPQYVSEAQQPFGRDQFRSPQTIAEILAKQSANPDLVRAEGSEGFIPKPKTEKERTENKALELQSQYPDLGSDEALRLAAAQIAAEKETDFVAAIAEDEDKMATRERVMGDTNQGLDDQSYVSKILAEEEAQKTLDAKNETAMATRERVMGDMDTGKGSVEEQMKNEVQNVVKNGTSEQQRSSLKELMAQFTDNAPKYEGMNMGLAIAKMGFAIAAGDSPNALTNIANGMKDGADAFIEDAAKRDAFKRQVSLSALQYGLGEESKYRAEDRAIAGEERAETRIRERALIGQTKYTAGDEGVTYKGRFYAPFTTVAVDKTDINNNKLPLGLMDTAVITALQARKTSSAKARTDLIKNNTLKPEQAFSQQEKYAKAVDNAIKAERGLGAVQDVMIQVADGVSGISNVGQDFLAQGKRILGMKNIKSSKIEEVRASFRRLLQDVVPLTLADSQSANSISNRDVDLLIRAYFGDNALDAGSFKFVALDENTILKNLSTVAEIMQNDQKSSFAEMTRIESGMAPLFQAGTTTSASNLLKFDQERLGDLVGKRSVGASTGYSRNEDGILVFNQG